MAQPAPVQVTQLLKEVGQGHASAADRLLPLVYDELRALASSYFRRQRADHTLQPTALVHEAYAKLVGASASDVSGSARWTSRAHFFAVAAKAMRQILANHARDRQVLKRGREWERVTLSEAVSPSNDRDLDLVALDGALGRLGEMDSRQSQIVELRFFADMTVEEISHVMGVSISTVEREWRMARAWLTGQLRSGDER